MDDDDVEEFLTIAALSSRDDHLDDRNIYDNRVTGKRGGEVGYIAPEELRTRYYDEKFSYFCRRLELLLEGRELPVEEATDPKGMLLARWDEALPEEAKAFILRILHIPEDVVRHTWYNELESFDSWSTLLKSAARTSTTRELGSLLDTHFPVCIEEENEALERIADLLRNLNDLAQSVVGVDSALHLARENRISAVVSRLGSAIATRLATHTTDVGDVVRAVVECLRDVYGFRVCDYLAVSSRPNGDSRLELLASSWHEGDVELIRRHDAAYPLAAGITGSVFLLKPTMQNRWIGTNSLTHDPRQSPRHSQLFGSIYGDSRSFMVFPVFDGDRLVGALRAIDPEPAITAPTLDPDGYRGFWPLDVRAELAQVSAWLGTILPIVGSALPGGSVSTPLLEVSRHPGLLRWIPQRFMSAVLAEVSRICSMKSEHRDIRCTLALGASESVTAFGERTTRYPSVGEDEVSGSLENAGEVFGRVLAGAGAFLCEVPSGVDSSVLPLRFSRVVATKCFSAEDVSRSYRDLELALVDVNGARKVGRFYERGAWVADYYLNEKSGQWQLRERASLMKRLRALQPVGMSDSLFEKLLWEYVVPYSYRGHGGLLVLSNDNPRDILAEPGFDVREQLQAMNLSLFESVVSVDGGTWINHSGFVRQAGMLFNSTDISHDARSGGARRQAAQTISASLENAVVIVISSNRLITVMKCGHGWESF